MSMTVEIELYGGAKDGHTFAATGPLSDVLRVPELPGSWWRYPDDQSGWPQAIYRWDGTVTEQGRRRYRREEAS